MSFLYTITNKTILFQTYLKMNLNIAKILRKNNQCEIRNRTNIS